jgi:S-adenosylmethionine hydrolase
VLSLAAPARAVRRDLRRVAVARPPPADEPTFHGRDVFAPVAAALAAGADPATLGTSFVDRARCDRPPRVARSGRVLSDRCCWVDRYGNLTTNVGRAAELESAGFRGRRLSTTIGAHVGAPFEPPMAASVPIVPSRSVNSSDLLEIAVNHGSGKPSGSGRALNAYFDRGSTDRAAASASRRPVGPAARDRGAGCG